MFLMKIFLAKIFLTKIFLAKIFFSYPSFFGENIFDKNIFGKIFLMKIFLGKGLHFPSHAHALLSTPYIQLPPLLFEVEGGTKQTKRTHGARRQGNISTDCRILCIPEVTVLIITANIQNNPDSQCILNNGTSDRVDAELQRDW